MFQFRICCSGLTYGLIIEILCEPAVFKRSQRHLQAYSSWWRGSVVERRSLAGELSLSCA